MSRGVLAVFGETSKQSYQTLKTFTNSYNLPFITWSKAVESEEDLESLSDNAIDDDFLGKIPHKETKSVEVNEIFEEADYSEDKQKDLNYDNDDSANNIISNYQLFLQPDLGFTLISLIKQSRWDKIYYIYNYDEGLISLKQLHVCHSCNSRN